MKKLQIILKVAFKSNTKNLAKV